MTAAWFLGAQQSVPQNETEVRSTLDIVRTDSTTAEADSPPDFNEFDSDESAELTGLTPRQVGSDTRDREKYPPWWAALATAPHNRFVDEQVATSGTAAKREERGEQGHGTVQYAVGITPEIRDGVAFGNDYFAFSRRDVQEGAGAYMTPDQSSTRWDNTVAAAFAAKNSRDAFQASLYQQFLGA